MYIWRKEVFFVLTARTSQVECVHGEVGGGGIGDYRRCHEYLLLCTIVVDPIKGV